MCLASVVSANMANSHIPSKQNGYQRFETPSGLRNIADHGPAISQNVSDSEMSPLDRSDLSVARGIEVAAKRMTPSVARGMPR